MPWHPAPSRGIRISEVVQIDALHVDRPSDTNADAEPCLKTDPTAFALMLGGVRSPQQAAAEMADDIAFRSEEGVGIFTKRTPNDPDPATNFRGITGVHRRPDGRGIGLRFALAQGARGQGLAREGAGRALRFTHDEGIPRVVAVCRDDNRASRLVLSGIGMRAADTFERDGNPMLVYESVRPAPASMADPSPSR